MKNLLLINGFGSGVSILNELLSNTITDTNIYLSYPLGVLTLAGWVRQELPDFNIHILDVHMDFHKAISDVNRSPMNIDDFIHQELDKIHFIPDYVGLSISFSNGHVACLKLINKCSERWPQSKVIVGGMHATTFTSELIAEPNVDFIVRGPGDFSFIELLKALEKKTNPDDIPSIISGIVTNLDNVDNFGVALKNLDDIPMYPYDLINMEYLVLNESSSPVYEREIRTGLILMSRGCQFHCTYCSANKIHGNKVSFKSLNRVLDEIQYLVENYKIEQLCIIDDLFGSDKKYFYDFFREIENRKLKLKLIIASGLSLLVFNEEMIDELIKHGLEAANFPLESGSQYVQSKIIKKHVDLAKAERMIKYAKNKNLFVSINVVIGSPGETKELMNETFEYIKTLPVDWTQFLVAYPYPGTEMTNTLIERGDITKEKLIEIWETSAQGFKERPFDTKEISGKELSSLVYDKNIMLNFFNNYNLKNKNYTTMLLKINKIIDRFPFHVVALSCRVKCYTELGEIKKAKADIATIFELIGSNKDSRDMYEKYRNNIEEMILLKCNA